MKVEQKGHTTVLKHTLNNVEAFVEKITNQYHEFQTQNLILDLSQAKEVSNDCLLHFKDFSRNHTKAKKSIIIVTDKVDIDKIPDYLSVVPSVLEAHDMIEMDEIERDLGF
ncbi:ribonuclease Z [Flavobacterium ardleyense]|uniref:Ribonuclease Z n=1 Tax=Flavobacterium ardleyense TaxID=2038737 RepID=A0ABW5ZA12_9FLAO